MVRSRDQRAKKEEKKRKMHEHKALKHEHDGMSQGRGPRPADSSGTKETLDH
uniref:Small EDRK-rich factor-like N-terminal domain-containing protein n=1 Tax=Setaria italica TaxID=4555 RepID=K3Z1V7_SETIT